MKRAVLQIADFAAPYSGNFIASLLALSNRLQNIGLRQILVLPTKANSKPWFLQLKKNDVPIHLIDTDRSIFHIARKIANISENENAAIIHTHFTRFDVPSYLAKMLLRCDKYKPKILWHIHSNFPIKSNFMRKFKDILKFRVMGRDSQIIVVSEELKQSTIYRGFHGKIHIIPNGIDINRATMTNRSRSDLRKEYGIQDGSKVLLSFGWEPITKGVDLLIEAAQKLAAEINFTLLIIGGTQLKEFIDNIVGKIWPFWLRIDAPRECVADLYKAADIFISASRWEGFPYAVGEAMANGLPVISSNINSLKWARSAPGVVFFDSYDARELFRVIKKIIGWPHQKLDSIAISNREFINTKYSINIWTKNICDIYKEILKN